MCLHDNRIVVVFRIESRADENTYRLTLTPGISIESCARVSLVNNYCKTMFKAAGKAEIIRSQQKDEFYLSYLRSLMADVTHSILGNFA